MNKKEMCDNSQTQVEKKEKINQYALSPENIIILDENSEIKKKQYQYRMATRVAGRRH